jgi:hypothetical protein
MPGDVSRAAQNLILSDEVSNGNRFKAGGEFALVHLPHGRPIEPVVHQGIRSDLEHRTRREEVVHDGNEPTQKSSHALP